MRDGEASDEPIDITVLTRMKQFQAMNKFKKVALKVHNLNLSFILSSFGPPNPRPLIVYIWYNDTWKAKGAGKLSN